MVKGEIGDDFEHLVKKALLNPTWRMGCWLMSDTRRRNNWIESVWWRPAFGAWLNKTALFTRGLLLKSTHHGGWRTTFRPPHFFSSSSDLKPIFAYQPVQTHLNSPLTPRHRCTHSLTHSLSLLWSPSLAWIKRSLCVCCSLTGPLILTASICRITKILSKA